MSPALRPGSQASGDRRAAGARASRRALRGAGFLSLSLLLAALLGGGTLLLVDVQRIVRAKAWLQHSWVVTHGGSAIETHAIETTLVRLRATAYSLPVLNGDFQNGGGAILPRGGQVLVAERTGRFFAVDLGQEPPTVRLLPLRLQLNEDALMAYARANGFAVAPGRNVGMAGLGTRVHDLLALEDGRLAAAYTHWDAARNCATLRVAVIALPADWTEPPPDDWRVVFDSRPCLPFRDNKTKPFSGHQAGGRLWPVGTGSLLVTVGDYKFDGSHAPDYPQDRTADYGKIFKIDLADGTRRLVSLGHRNPQGLTQDRAGRVWSTEHGPEGGDELNLVEDGRNYGWPLVTLGTDCRTCDWQRQGRHDGFAPPVYAWVPSIGVSNLLEVRDFAPDWEGDLLVASLKNESLHRLRLDGDRVQYDEPIFVGDRIRDLARRDDGAILLWTDSGRLIALAVDEELSPAERLVSQLAGPVRETLADCRQCHSFDDGQGAGKTVALWGVFGRRIAGDDGARYSPALKALPGSWDEAALDRFLADPQAMVPGTTMNYGGIADPRLRRAVVAFLQALQ